MKIGNSHSTCWDTLYHTRTACVWGRHLLKNDMCQKIKAKIENGIGYGETTWNLNPVVRLWKLHSSARNGLKGWVVKPEILERLRIQGTWFIEWFNDTSIFLFPEMFIQCIRYFTLEFLVSWRVFTASSTNTGLEFCVFEDLRRRLSSHGLSHPCRNLARCTSLSLFTTWFLEKILKAFLTKHFCKESHHTHPYSHLGISVGLEATCFPHGGPMHHFEGYMPLSASSALAGLLGGGLAQAVASPADRLKVHFFWAQGGPLPVTTPVTYLWGHLEEL